MTTKKEKRTVKIGAAVLQRHKDGIEVSVPRIVGSKTLLIKDKDGIEYTEHQNKIVLEVQVHLEHKNSLHVKLFNKYGIKVLNQNVPKSDIID